MLWLKFLHIAALTIWCGMLLYFPALLWQSLAKVRDQGFDRTAPFMPRLLFACLATPAALLAIISGTLLFLLFGVLGGWLIFKLAAVAVMVISHVLLGGLVLRLEEGKTRWLRLVSLVSLVLTALSMLLVLALVLAEPMDWTGGIS